MFRTPRPRLGHSNALHFRPRLVSLDDRITPTLDFGTPQFSAVNGAPVAVATGDINGDGRPDLVTANSTTNTVSVLVNSTPTGGVTPAFDPAIDFSTASPTAVALADFNGDGRLDIATASSSAGTVSVLLNSTPVDTATPTFDPPRSYTVGNLTGAISVGDFNGDGRMDLVTVGRGGVYLLLNATVLGDQSTVFDILPRIALVADPNSVVVADFNGDGRPDIATTETYEGGASTVRYQTYLTVFTNTTTPGLLAFTSERTHLYFSLSFSGGPFTLASGDFDGDGRSDLAYANRSTVGVLSNRTPAGAARTTFDPARTFATGRTAVGAPTVADFDGDGRADLAVSTIGTSPQVVAVLRNTTVTFDPVVTFSAAQSYIVAADPRAIAVADLDADGRIDLVTANAGPGLVTVLPNSSVGSAVTGPPVVGQFGTAGVWQLNRTTGGWNQLTAANADAIAVAPNGNVVASFGDDGVWYYQPAHGWYQINGNRATAITIDGLGNVAASFEGFGTAQYRLADGWTAPLTSVAADRLDLNRSGELAAHFPNYGLYTYTTAGGWRFLHGYPIPALALGENGDVTVSFVGFGVNAWRPTADWIRLNDTDATALATSESGTRAAAFVGDSVARYSPATHTWQTLHAGTPVPSVATDLYGNVFATLGGFGVYEFNPFAGWRVRTTSAADFLAIG